MDNKYPKPDRVRFNLYSIQSGFGSESVPVQILQFRPNGNIADPSLKHEKRGVLRKQVHFSVVLLVGFKKARRTNYWMETEHFLLLFVAHDLGDQFVYTNSYVNQIKYILRLMNLYAQNWRINKGLAWGSNLHGRGGIFIESWRGPHIHGVNTPSIYPSDLNYHPFASMPTIRVNNFFIFIYLFIFVY